LVRSFYFGIYSLCGEFRGEIGKTTNPARPKSFHESPDNGGLESIPRADVAACFPRVEVVTDCGVVSAGGGLRRGAGLFIGFQSAPPITSKVHTPSAIAKVAKV